MLDYRARPETSPWVFCPAQKQLISSDKCSKVMKTAFYISPEGIFPYGVFEPTQIEEPPRTLGLTHELLNFLKQMNVVIH